MMTAAIAKALRRECRCSRFAISIYKGIFTGILWKYNKNNHMQTYSIKIVEN